MKIWKKKVGDILSNCYGIYNRQFHQNSGHLILMYHSVSSTTGGGYSDIYTIDKTLFKEHMLILLSFMEVTGLTAKSIHQNAAAVTFDDGYADNLDVVAPIMDDLKIPFTVFVTSDYVRSTSKKYLSLNALGDLASLSGITIGAHGSSHCRLTDCNDVELKKEIVDSKKFLEDTVGNPIESMSYPHGSANKRVINEVKSAGYKLAVGSLFGINQHNVDRHYASRTEIWSIDNTETFLAKIRGDWDWMRWRN